MAVVEVAVLRWPSGPGPHPPAEGRDVASSMWWTGGVSMWWRWGARWRRRSHGYVAQAHIPQRRGRAAGPWWGSVGGDVVELKGEGTNINR